MVDELGAAGRLQAIKHAQQPGCRLQRVHRLSPTKGRLRADRTVPGCSAAITASGRRRAISIAAVCSSMLSAALDAR